jgi:NADPH-dependent 2,4-dienoyl-CoA reductase/sulfur reductase-like enzyme
MTLGPALGPTHGSSGRDPASIAGAALPVEERTTLLVVGAGYAGLAAALAAARAGQAVVLVDENPIPAETMGDDVPQFFGGRVGGAARNKGAMTEAFVASDPLIEQAFDAGVDVRLGVACWGIYANGPSVGWLPGPVAGLADGERSWLIGAKRIIVATGRRDMGLAFDGWAQPGVMGMEAAYRLATRYGALDVRRAIVLGSTAEAMTGAAALQAAGVEILAIVEPGPAPLADPGDLPILCHHSIRRAEGGPDGVEAVTLAGPLGEIRITCDTVILAVGAVPLIELLDSVHCRTVFDPARGGHVPVLDADLRTSVPAILAAGDCAGIWPGKSRNPAIAAAEGRRAALGEGAIDSAPLPAHDIAAYRLGWVRDAVLAGRDEPYVCQCEEVTAREIMEVRPPRYLDAKPDRRNTRELTSLLGNGPPNPDQVKRLTRAGMGLCQGRRCREQVAALLALGANVPLAEVPLAAHRAPVRPMPLRLAAASEEDPHVAEHWDVWFGMKSQYVPHWRAPEHFTSATRDAGDDRGTE